VTVNDSESGTVGNNLLAIMPFALRPAPAAAGGQFPPFPPRLHPLVFWTDEADTGRASRDLTRVRERGCGLFPLDLSGRGFLDRAEPRSRAARRQLRKVRETTWRS